MKKLILVCAAIAASMLCGNVSCFAAEIAAEVQTELTRGQALMDSGDWSKASETWAGALKKLSDAQWGKRALADLYARYGDQLVRQKAWTEARPLLIEAGNLYEQSDTLSPKMAPFYANLANACELGADPDSTAGEKARRKALGLLIFDNGATSSAIVDQLQLLALNRFLEKDYKNAAVLYGYEAGLLYMARPDQSSLAGCFSQLGQCFEQQGQWRGAEQFYRQALNHYKNTGKQDLELAQYTNLYGRALAAMGQKPEGEKLMTEAADLRKKIGVSRQK